MKARSEYDQAVNRSWKDYSWGHQKMYTMGIELISGTPAEILDIGCGVGWGFERMALMSRVVKRYVGVDPDAKCIDHCRERWGKPPKVAFRQCAWPEQIDIQSCRPVLLDRSLRRGHSREGVGKFDFTFCIETIEHICEPGEPDVERLVDFLQAARLVTRVGMFLSTPNAGRNQHGVWMPVQVCDALHDSGWSVTWLPWQWTDMYVCGVI